MKKLLMGVVVLLATTLFISINASANKNSANVESGCNYNVYNQSSDGHITGEILYYNTCEMRKVAVAYKVYDSKWKYQYTTASYTLLSYTRNPKRISLSYQSNGSNLELIDWCDAETEDCGRFMRHYKK